MLLAHNCWPPRQRDIHPPPTRARGRTTCCAIKSNKFPFYELGPSPFHNPFPLWPSRRKEIQNLPKWIPNTQMAPTRFLYCWSGRKCVKDGKGSTDFTIPFFFSPRRRHKCNSCAAKNGLTILVLKLKTREKVMKIVSEARWQMGK